MEVLSGPFLVNSEQQLAKELADTHIECEGRLFHHL